MNLTFHIKKQLTPACASVTRAPGRCGVPQSCGIWSARPIVLLPARPSNDRPNYRLIVVLMSSLHASRRTGSQAPDQTFVASCSCSVPAVQRRTSASDVSTNNWTRLKTIRLQRSRRTPAIRYRILFDSWRCIERKLTKKLKRKGKVVEQSSYS